MILKLNFEGTTETFSKPLNEEVNGLINKWLGENNEYHGTFSRYCVSTMQGGSMNNDGIISFPNGGYVMVSTDDIDFISKLTIGIFNTKDGAVKSMKFKNFEINEFVPYKEYDIIRTISPILITNKEGKSLTFKDDSFIEELTTRSIKKLINCGLNEKIANTLTIEYFHKDKAKTKMVELHSQKNICSQVMLVVRGDKEARKKIYELGFGKSTGFGFGAVTIIRK
jgi:CRISPR-associated endoribonuclease Cas6